MKQIPSEQQPQLPPLPGYPYFPQEEKEVHLLDYWRVIRKRQWIIVAVLLVAVVVSVVNSSGKKPVYRGTATIQINNENPQIVDFREIFTVSGWAVDYYQTQYKILESRNLAKRVVHKLKLWDHPEFLPEPQTPFQEWKSNVRSSIVGVLKPFNFLAWSRKQTDLSPDPPPADEASEEERDVPYIGQLLGRLKIEPIKDSRLVKIHFDAYHPVLAGQVPNALAEEYIQLTLESRVNTTEQAKEWLGKQLDELKAKVERADEAQQEFGAKYGIISLDEKESIAMKRLNELNEALAKAESERMSKEALYRQIKQDKDPGVDALPSVLENKLIQDLKQTYVQLEAQYMKLSETFKPGYPEMVNLKNQMDAVQKRLNIEISKIVAGIKNEYESSVRKESLLRTAFEEQKARATETQQKAIRYNILKRESDTNKELYKNLLQRIKEVGVSSGFKGSNAQIVDRAEVPRGPYKPDTRREILLASLVGLFLGVGLVFFLEYLDNTVKTAEEVEQILGLPYLGMVPAISCEKPKTLPAGTTQTVELVTFERPRSILSEAYRSIRTSILLSFAEQPPKSIVFTSPNPLEGKTTTMLNTAISLSQTGARVVIVDADMRKPRVHEILEKGNGRGLSKYLTGHAKLKSVIRRTPVKNLYYIPSGIVPPNPSELLGSPMFKEMLQTLGERFDHIIIDSPPVIGIADSVILSAAADGVILVVAGGKTPREAVKLAKESMLQVNAKILGVVINRINIRRKEYSHYYYRYHYYYTSNYYAQEEKRKKQLPYISNSGVTSA